MAFDKIMEGIEAHKTGSCVNCPYCVDGQCNRDEFVDDLIKLCMVRPPKKYESRAKTPCPCCGQKPQLWTSAKGYMLSCTFCMRATRWHGAEIRAIREWNELVEERRI